MVPWGNHTLTVVTLVLRKTFLKLLFWSHCQRYFTNHMKKPSQCLFVTEYTPVLMTASLFLPQFCFDSAPLTLTVLLPVIWGCPGTGFASLSSGARTFRLCCCWVLLTENSMSLETFLHNLTVWPPLSVQSSFHRNKDGILVIPIIRHCVNPWYKHAASVFL